MEVQMILSQVGERADGEAHAAHAVENQRVRRDFHDAVRAASLGHACKQCLQLVGLGRGALGRDDLVTDHVLIGADEANLMALGFQNVLDQRGGRGLAVGAGHADHGELARGMVEAVARDVGQCGSGIGNDDRRDALAGLLAHDCNRALLEGHADIGMAVGGEAAHGDEQVTRLDGARVIAHLADVDIQIDRGVGERDILQ